MLLALAAIQRESKIRNLDTSVMAKTKNKDVFYLKTVTKIPKPGKISPDMIFYAFSDNPNLSPVETLDCYFNISEPWRTKG